MTCIHHRKMAQAPALELCHAHHRERKPHCTTSISLPVHLGTSVRLCSTRRWCRKMAHTPAPPSHSEPFIQLVLTHIHQLLVGNPCPCWRSTKPSWLQTSLLANSRNHRHNCRGLQGPVAVSADHRCGATGSTNP